MWINDLHVCSKLHVQLMPLPSQINHRFCINDHTHTHLYKWIHRHKHTHTHINTQTWYLLPNFNKVYRGMGEVVDWRTHEQCISYLLLRTEHTLGMCHPSQTSSNRDQLIICQLDPLQCPQLTLTWKQPLTFLQQNWRKQETPSLSCLPSRPGW